MMCLQAGSDESLLEKAVATGLFWFYDGFMIVVTQILTVSKVENVSSCTAGLHHALPHLRGLLCK